MCFTNHIKAHETFCPCSSKSRTLCWDNLLITFTFGHLYPSAIFCHIGILVKLKFRLIAIFCYGLIVSILLCIYISSTCISAFKLGTKLIADILPFAILFPMCTFFAFTSGLLQSVFLYALSMPCLFHFCISYCFQFMFNCWCIIIYIGC